MIEWIRATFPAWTFYVVGPLLVIAGTLGLRPVLGRWLRPPRATIWAGTVTVALLLPGHQRGGGGERGLTLMLASLLVALAVGLLLDRRSVARS